ncbi:redox-sensing transcriptional repressor Rex, partial [Nocardia tengchongensis]
TVPDAAAQGVCDLLVAAGLQCVLSFSALALEAPATVEVRRVDLAVEMQLLSFERARNAESAAEEAMSAAAGALLPRVPMTTSKGAVVQP